jgi:hypothetical protein
VSRCRQLIEALAVVLDRIDFSSHLHHVCMGRYLLVRHFVTHFFRFSLDDIALGSDDWVERVSQRCLADLWQLTMLFSQLLCKVGLEHQVCLFFVGFLHRYYISQLLYGLLWRLAFTGVEVSRRERGSDRDEPRAVDPCILFLNRFEALSVLADVARLCEALLQLCAEKLHSFWAPIVDETFLRKMLILNILN